MTTADTLQHNGVAERMNCTLVEWVCTMLINTKLPNSYWWDALQYAVLLHNVSPMCSLSDCTPKESWSRNKPNISHLQVFGCKAFVHIPDKMCGKLSAMSLICTFIRYTWQHKAYCLVHHPSGHFLKSHDIIFNKGGTNTSYKHIILNANDMSLPLITLAPTPSSAPVPTPSLSTSTSEPSITTPIPTSTNVQPTPITSCPKHTICVMFYGLFFFSLCLPIHSHHMTAYLIHHLTPFLLGLLEL